MKSKVVNTKLGQLVPLPKTVALPEHVTQVDVFAVGRTRVITPVGESWDSWFDGPDVSPDFMMVREQEAEEGGESFNGTVFHNKRGDIGRTS